MDKYIFAITGPTGSGKSTVSNIFRSLGVYVADADKAAKEVTAKGTECLERIRDAFGESVITENGELNRKKLSQIVFNDDIEQLDSPFSWDEFEYRPNVLETLKTVQDEGYYIFIVTNQPAAAKGKVPLEQIYELNRHMVEDLRRKGIFVEFVSICPHHPNGYSYAKAQFLIGKCDCRKPKAGMLNGIMKRYSINVEKSFMVG